MLIQKICLHIFEVRLRGLHDLQSIIISSDHLLEEFLKVQARLSTRVNIASFNAKLTLSSVNHFSQKNKLPWIIGGVEYSS